LCYLLNDRDELARLGWEIDLLAQGRANRLDRAEHRGHCVIIPLIEALNYLWSLGSSPITVLTSCMRQSTIGTLHAVPLVM
jgi:hypothetical protein